MQKSLLYSILFEMAILVKENQEVFKIWVLGFLFFLTGFHIFDIYFYPTIVLISDRIIISVVLVCIGYLWIQELRDRVRLQIINNNLLAARKELEQTHLNTISALVLSLETKDPYARGHSERVTKYSIAIAKELGLPAKEIEAIKQAGKIHDIGKLGIDDAILSKPGKLTEKEYAIIKTHPQMGTAILGPLDFLNTERIIMRHHHEKYDGTGYPDKLKGEEIPLGARIMALTDAFDAMKSERPYRKPLSDETILSEIKKNTGSQFDPKIVETFLSLASKNPEIFNFYIPKP